MENTDIDMVISIPDTPPDRAVIRRGPVTREFKRRPRSPEAPAGYQTEEYRNYLKGRTRPVPEVGENRESSDTRTENGYRSRSSGSNALFRRMGVEKDRGKAICTDPCAAPVEKNPVVSNGHARVTSSRGLPSIEIRELPASNGFSPLRGDHNSFKLPGIIGNKGKEKVDGGSASNRETIDLSSDKKPSRGTKRLVRHGCISPIEIAARAKQVVDTSSKDTVSVEPEIAPEIASSIGIREIVSGNEVHRRARGKRPEIPHNRMSSRDAVDSEPERWISTRNRNSNIGHESDTQEICSSASRIDVQETVGEVEREARQQRRRKNGFTTARALNEAEVSGISSSGEPSNSRPSRTQNHQRQGIQQVLEIEDSSPDERVFRRPRRVFNDESYLNVRQIEADEMLARELQEQLYQESALNTNEHIDENIARLLAQEENSLRASSSSSSTSNTQRIAVPGLRSRMEARQQGDTRRRRVNTLQGRLPVRAPPRGRGQRLGRDSASLHRSLNLSFPNDMGLDSRLNFLEELENVFGHTVNNRNLLHMDRDFTEDDYELLLALDDNNHRHGGASTHRINNLPESTVQNDNFQETCVICLETPTIGDTIRHLPCLHKFHKDCIDPWLGRSKACPVCKSSVT